MTAMDQLTDLQEDISGLAHMLQFANKECREHTGSTEVFHITKSLESYEDILGEVVRNLETAEHTADEIVKGSA